MLQNIYRNFEIFDIVNSHRPLLPHPPSWIKSPAQPLNPTSIFGPPKSHIVLSISHAFTRWGSRQGFQARHPSIKFLQARLVNFRPEPYPIVVDDQASRQVSDLWGRLPPAAVSALGLFSTSETNTTVGGWVRA